MKSLPTVLVASALVAGAVVTGSGQGQLKPKTLNLPKSVLTKPTSIGAGVASTKSSASILAGKAPIVDLGLPDGSSDARDINEAGMALVNNLDKKTCFLWSPAEGFKPVLAEGANFSLEGDDTVAAVVGRGINNNGQVAGNVVLSDKRLLAFLWDPESGMRLLGTLAGGSQSVAVDVSDNGIVAGTSLTGKSKSTAATDAPELFNFKEGCAFAWAEDMGMVPIGRFGTLRSWATAINSKGVIAGTFGSHVVGTETTQSFLWSREEGAEIIQWHLIYSSTDRVTSGAAMAMDVRDDGTVPMFYYHYSNMGDKPYPGRLNTAVLVRNGLMRHEFKSSDQGSTYKIYPMGLNGSDICVGYQEYRGGNNVAAPTAFAWRPGSEIADLSNFATGWTMSRAYRINSKHQVVGIGTHEGKTKGFIMNLSPSLLPTPLSKGLVEIKSGAKLVRPKIVKPPK